VKQPTLQEAATPGHYFACFYPVGSPETRAVKERLEVQRLMSTAPGTTAVPPPMPPTVPPPVPPAPQAAAPPATPLVPPPFPGAGPPTTPGGA
jgi:hypothetical protein